MLSGQGPEVLFSNIDTRTLYGHLINGYCSYFYCKTISFNALPCFIKKATNCQNAVRNKNCICGKNKPMENVDKHQTSSAFSDLDGFLNDWHLLWKACCRSTFIDIQPNTNPHPDPFVCSPVKSCVNMTKTAHQESSFVSCTRGFCVCVCVCVCVV